LQGCGLAPNFGREREREGEKKGEQR